MFDIQSRHDQKRAALANHTLCHHLCVDYAIEYGRLQQTDIPFHVLVMRSAGKPNGRLHFDSEWASEKSLILEN